MSDAEFPARPARIEQGRAPQSSAALGTAGGPPRNDRERLHRALAVAAAAGISPAAGFPPFMRALAALGVPVRPLHHKSAFSLFLSGVLLGLCVFGGVLWLVSAPDVGAPRRGPVAGLVSLGWAGVCAMSAAIGLVLAAIIKAQAVRAGLPRWRDL